VTTDLLVSREHRTAATRPQAAVLLTEEGDPLSRPTNADTKERTEVSRFVSNHNWFCMGSDLTRHRIEQTQ
jgi:hypothetical protein